MVIPISSGKARRNLPAAKYRARRAVVVRGVLVGHQISLPSAFPEGVRAHRPEIRIAAENHAVAKDDNAAGPSLDAVAHLDVHGVEPVLHFGAARKSTVISENPVTPELIDWADLILVMEKAHRAKLARMFPVALRGKRVVCLNIPDNYEFMDPDLVQLLKDRVARFVPSS